MPGWPAKGDLDYTKTLIEVVLLALAIPYVVARLTSNPGAVSKAAAHKHVGTA